MRPRPRSGGPALWDLEPRARRPASLRRSLPPALPLQLIVCTLVFTLVAGGGYILFGSSTQANILNNLTPDSLAPVVGQAMGSVLSFANRLGYCISLMVRISLMVLHQPHGTASASWYCISLMVLHQPHGGAACLRASRPGCAPGWRPPERWPTPLPACLPAAYPALPPSALCLTPAMHVPRTASLHCRPPLPC